MVINSNQFKEILKSLQLFKKERNLYLVDQRNGLLGNLLEEMTEHIRAKDEYEKIDSLCDMIVFTANALDNTDGGVKIDQLDLNNIILEKVEMNDEFLTILIPQVTMARSNEMYMVLVRHLLNCIYTLGYDPYLCLLETLKEIHSRTGEYNSEIRKFVKYKGAYSKSDIQKDYPIAIIYVTEDIDNGIYRVYQPDDSVLKENEDKTEILVTAIANQQQVGFKQFDTYVMWYKADYSKCKLN